MNYAIRELPKRPGSESNGSARPVAKPASGPAAEPRPQQGAVARQRPLAEPFIEGFRLLALDLERLLGEAPDRSVVVMSALPKEGRSMTALNIARAMTDIAPPLALVDANPLPAGVVAPAEELPYQVIRPWAHDTQQTAVIDHIRRVLDDARRAGGTVVIDVPAATTSSLGFFLAPMVGGVLYLARPSRIRNVDVAAAVRAQLDLLGARILGVVVNEG